MLYSLMKELKEPHTAMYFAGHRILKNTVPCTVLSSLSHNINTFMDCPISKLGKDIKNIFYNNEFFETFSKKL